MALTITEIYTYIKNFRMSPTLANNATGNNDNKGIVAINSALIWAQGGFYKVSRDTEWSAFETALFALTSSDLKDYAQLLLKLTSQQRLCLEAIVEYTIYQIYALGESEEFALDKKKTAESLLSKVVGKAALDGSEKGNGANVKTEPNITVSTPTADEILADTDNFKVY